MENTRDYSRERHRIRLMNEAIRSATVLMPPTAAPDQVLVLALVLLRQAGDEIQYGLRRAAGHRGDELVVHAVMDLVAIQRRQGRLLTRSEARCYLESVLDHFVDDEG